MTKIVKTIARLIAGFIFLYGIYIILHGHLTPGGGFAGGVIIAGSFCLLVLAEGAQETKAELMKARASLSESMGIFLFWLVGLNGLLAGGYFLWNFLGKGQPFKLFSAGIIPLCNIAIGIEVAAALFAIFITLTVFKKEEEK